VTAEHTLIFTAPPPALTMYRRLFFCRRPGLRPGESLPRMTARRPGAQAIPAKLAAYRRACGFADDGCLPMLFPHVLSTVLQMGIIAEPVFPLSPLGMVHRRNHMLQRRPIRENEVMDLECRIAASRVVTAGLEFDFTTTAVIDGQRVWECISTYLARGKNFGEPGPPNALAALPPLDNPEINLEWKVPHNMGRRYARITGDYNPIHVSRFLARRFGFPRDIIHGMWSAATALARLPELPADIPVRFDIVFKGPIFIGSDVTLRGAASEDRCRFDLFCEGNPRPCVNALYRIAGNSETLIA